MERYIPNVIVCACFGILVGKFTGSGMVLNGIMAGLGSVFGIVLHVLWSRNKDDR